MSDELDSYVDEAMAALDDASVRELEATADLLERRRDGVGKFSGIFSQVAWHREDRSDPSLARFHLREAVSPPDNGESP